MILTEFKSRSALCSARQARTPARATGRRPRRALAEPRGATSRRIDQAPADDRRSGATARPDPMDVRSLEPALADTTKIVFGHIAVAWRLSGKPCARELQIGDRVLRMWQRRPLCLWLVGRSDAEPISDRRPEAIWARRICPGPPKEAELLTPNLSRDGQLHDSPSSLAGGKCPSRTLWAANYADSIPQYAGDRLGGAPILRSRRIYPA